MAILEICAADIESARNASLGGADRIELCSALEAGGVGPSFGLIREAVEIPGLTVNVLIRPRGGDFVYSEAEGRVMEQDIEAAADCGARAAVIGALRPDGTINMELCRRLVDAAHRRGLQVTFHRAFDRCVRPLEALEEVIELGCDRLLSSGCAPTAEQGLPLLKRLVERANGRISVMPGAGVSARNATRLLKDTGAWEIHASCKTLRPGVADPALRSQAEGECFITSPQLVADVKRAINNL